MATCCCVLLRGCPLAVSLAGRIIPDISMARDAGTSAHLPACVGGCPLHLQPRGSSPGVPGGEAPLSPPRRGPSCADGSSAAPGRILHPHVRGFLCPSWLCAGLAPSVPSPPPPAPPSQPPPEPATHTSELFCVFQQLKRIKQQLSPGRAWILVTLIFCVAGQGEWGY